MGRISEGRIVAKKEAEKFPSLEKYFFYIYLFYLFWRERMTFLGFLDFGPHNEAIDQQTVLSFQTYRKKYILYNNIMIENIVIIYLELHPFNISIYI